MNATVLLAIYTLLHDDATLQGVNMLGGVDHVVTGWRTDDAPMPCLTITENSEPSDPRVGYAIHKHRDSFPVIQIDLWFSMDSPTAPTTDLEVAPVCDRIDTLLLKPGNVANTRSWRRSSTSPLSPDPDAPRELHKALRYSFEYSVVDS